MINQYKRPDVFRCNYESHGKFENKVSVYHVLKKKKCWPTGCISFKWKCDLMNKGKRCVRGYKYMGKKCGGCSHYSDDKIHNQPRMMLNETEAQKFREDLADFEDWLDDHLHKEELVLGTIKAVKPQFKRQINYSQESLSVTGYTLAFEDGYIGMTSFEDVFFARISAQMQTQQKFSVGDQIEFRATLFLDEGRLVFRKMRQIDFVEKSKEQAYSTSELLIEKQTATRFKTQHYKCLNCREGMLVDVEELKDGKIFKRRELICLKGMPEPELCIEPTLIAMENSEECKGKME